jgi:hypothetical protein
MGCISLAHYFNVNKAISNKFIGTCKTIDYKYD